MATIAQLTVCGTPTSVCGYGGADIYQIAKHCRTSVEINEKYYASNLKDTLDTAAINVRKSKVRTVRRYEL